MRIDLSDGILIEGRPDELQGLAEDLENVAHEGGEAAGSFLTEDGVERFIIRALEERA